MSNISSNNAFTNSPGGSRRRLGSKTLEDVAAYSPETKKSAIAGHRERRRSLSQKRPTWVVDDMDDTIWLDVTVRECNFKIPCAVGSQTFQWLGSVVAARYAREHPEFLASQFHCVHIMDALGQPLFPFLLIGEVCSIGESIEVELVGPKVGLNDPQYKREKTLWEAYAYTPPQDYVCVDFTFDTREFQPLMEPPGLFGNFNNWGVPILMQHATDDPHVFKHQISFPADAQVVFKFVLNPTSKGEHEGHEGDFSPETVIVSNYTNVQDGDGNEMNYFHVVQRDRDYSELEICEPETYEIEPVDEDPPPPVPKMTKRIIGRFKPVPQMTEQLMLKQFEIDWEKVQVADAVRLKADRMKCRDALFKFSPRLRRIFRFFSSQGGRDIAFMNILKFVHFCHICKIPDKRITVSVIDGVFHRVNIEEVFDEEKIAANPQSYRYAMVLKEDPFNPDNQFIRGEFYEALLRIALLKYRSLSPVDAFTKLMQNHVLPYALETSTDDIRERLLTEDCQRVYAVYSPRLYKLFKHYAKQDLTDMKPNASTTLNLREYDMMLEHLGLMDMRISRRIAYTAFALAQEEEAGEDQAGLYEMVYSEYLEVLARLADYRYGLEHIAKLLKGNGKNKDTRSHLRQQEMKHYSKALGDDKWQSRKKLQLHEKLKLLFGYMFPADKKSQQMLLKQRAEVLQQEELAAQAARDEVERRELEAQRKTKKKKRRPKKKPVTTE